MGFTLREVPGDHPKHETQLMLFLDGNGTLTLAEAAALGEALVAWAREQRAGPAPRKAK